MKRVIIWMAVAMFMAGLTGCATAPRADRTVVGIDVRHGQAWPGLIETLASNGYKAVTIEQPLSAETLAPVGILLIAAPSKSYTVEELDAVERFVKSGGGLLAAAQAWSWTYKEYGNKPIATFPLNIIGRRLQFRITEHNIGAPAHYNTAIMAGIGQVERNDWWPSKVEVNRPDGQAIIQDENRQTMGARQSFGRGRIVLYGHDGILKDNPKLLIQSLDHLAGLR